MSKTLQKIYTIVTTAGDSDQRYLVSTAILPDEDEEQFAMRVWKLIYPDSLEPTQARKIDLLWVVLTRPDERTYSLREDEGERIDEVDWDQIKDDIESGNFVCLDIMPLDLDNVRTL